MGEFAAMLAREDESPRGRFASLLRQEEEDAARRASTTFLDVLKKVPGSAVVQTVAGLAGTVAKGINPYSDTGDDILDYQRRSQEGLNEVVSDYTGANPGFASEVLGGAAAAVPGMAEMFAGAAVHPLVGIQSAFRREYEGVKSAGGSDRDAALTAGVNSLLEYVPVAKAFSVVKGATKESAASLVRVMLEQAGTEAGTEALQTVSENLIAAATYAKDNDLTMRDLVHEVAVSAGAGAVLGGLTGGLAGGIPRIRRARRASPFGWDTVEVGAPADGSFQYGVEADTPPQLLLQGVQHPESPYQSWLPGGRTPLRIDLVAPEQLALPAAGTVVEDGVFYATGEQAPSRLPGDLEQFKNQLPKTIADRMARGESLRTGQLQRKEIGVPRRPVDEVYVRPPGLDVGGGVEYVGTEDGYVKSVFRSRPKPKTVAEASRIMDRELTDAHFANQNVPSEIEPGPTPTRPSVDDVTVFTEEDLWKC